MGEPGFRRLFWTGAAALLGVAAVVAVVALVRGGFTLTDGKILGTVAAAFLTGAACLAGLALIDRRDLVPLGWGVAAVGVGGFAVLTWQVWSEFSSEEWSIDTAVIVVAGMMVATARLLSRGFDWLYRTSAVVTSVAAAVFVWAIHAEPGGDSWGEALGVVGIVTVLAWFLVPVLGRAFDVAEGETPLAPSSKTNASAV